MPRQMITLSICPHSLRAVRKDKCIQEELLCTLGNIARYLQHKNKYKNFPSKLCRAHRVLWAEGTYLDIKSSSVFVYPKYPDAMELWKFWKEDADQ